MRTTTVVGLMFFTPTTALSTHISIYPIQLDLSSDCWSWDFPTSFCTGVPKRPVEVAATRCFSMFQHPVGWFSIGSFDFRMIKHKRIMLNISECSRFRIGLECCFQLINDQIYVKKPVLSSNFGPRHPSIPDDPASASHLHRWKRQPKCDEFGSRCNCWNFAIRYDDPISGEL